ncbi:MAG: hypothetical protein JRI96_18750 [Deltaproteobacteria bacterium]|nr:hypothetical protein [Deltaproteobacteria bacterium]MBW2046878.1 hypothetical protein [Deltaproteobacteria bacterium]
MSRNMGNIEPNERQNGSHLFCRRRRHYAEAVLQAHRRVRTAARRKGIRYRVEPHLPPDVLGIYVYLPVV